MGPPTASARSGCGVRRASGCLIGGASASAWERQRCRPLAWRRSAPITCGRLVSSSTSRRERIQKLLHVVDEFPREALAVECEQADARPRCPKEPRGPRAPSRWRRRRSAARECRTQAGSQREFGSQLADRGCPRKPSMAGGSRRDRGCAGAAGCGGLAPGSARERPMIPVTRGSWGGARSLQRSRRDQPPTRA